MSRNDTGTSALDPSDLIDELAVAATGRFDQDPHATVSPSVERDVGLTIRGLRERQGLSIAALATATGLSRGMLSRIENGRVSASLTTLQTIAGALSVSIASLFRALAREPEATHVRAGAGLSIARRGTRAGHHYRLLGRPLDGPLRLEPYLVVLNDEADTFPTFQHEGLEFLYLLEGEVGYRYGGRRYDMLPGDSLFFDARQPHGPERLVRLPIRLLSVIAYES